VLWCYGDVTEINVEPFFSSKNEKKVTHINAGGESTNTDTDLKRKEGTDSATAVVDRPASSRSSMPPAKLAVLTFKL